MANVKKSSRRPDGAPGPAELATLLGRSHEAFQVLARRPGATSEWKRYGKDTPWVLKVEEGERTLYYVTPKPDRFEVTVVLGKRATEAALSGRVRPELHAAIRSANPYVEGRPVRVMVGGMADLEGVAELVAVKLKPTLPPGR
jgi:hypothetical protein